MKNNFFAGIIDAIWNKKTIQIEWEKDEQPRDLKGRWSKEQAKVIFYGDLIREVSQ